MNKKLILKYVLKYISAGGTFYEENRTRMGFEELITLCLDVTSAALNNPLIFQNLSSEKSRKFVISSVFCSLDIFSQQAQNFGTSIFSHGSHSNQPICGQFEEIFESGEETPSIVAAIRLNDMLSELILVYQSSSCSEGSEIGSSSLTKLPPDWFKNYRDIVIGLSRTPLFTTYMRIPTEIWTMGWRVEPQITSNEMLVIPYNIPGKSISKWLCRYQG